MPYITEKQKDELEARPPQNVGELTYLLYLTCLKYAGSSPNYQTYAEILGALTATQHELYRRRVAPYEDRKILENGDVDLTNEQTDKRELRERSS